MELWTPSLTRPLDHITLHAYHIMRTLALFAALVFYQRATAFAFTNGFAKQQRAMFHHGYYVTEQVLKSRRHAQRLSMVDSTTPSSTNPSLRNDGNRNNNSTSFRHSHNYTETFFWTPDQQPILIPLNTATGSRNVSFATPKESDHEPQKLTSSSQQYVAELLKEPILEVLDIGLVLGSCLLAAFSTVDSIDLNTMASIIRAQNVIAYIFAIDFFLRWYSQFTWKGMASYLTKPLVMVDVFVVILPLIPLLIPNTANAYNMLPQWLTSSSGLINLRLLRLLRLQRVLTDMETFSKFETALGISRSTVKPYQLQLARVVLSVFTLLSVSSGLIYTTEHNVNPDIPDYFTALYFGLTTLTTVGFGDITPVTGEGKLVVSLSILAGVAVIPAQAAALVEALLEREEYRKVPPANRPDITSTLPSSVTVTATATTPAESEMMEHGVCPFCNAGFHWSNAHYCWSCGMPFHEDDAW